MVTAAPRSRHVRSTRDWSCAEYSTVLFTPLLATPPTVTTTLPVVAPLGTDATMLVALQLVVLAVVPLKEIGRASCRERVEMLTAAATGPEVGVMLVMDGADEHTAEFKP